MRTIQLTQGFITTVDDEDYERLMQHKWSAQRNWKMIYAVRGTKYNDPSGTRKLIMMHREILHLEHSKQRIDHKNRDGLDNQKHNLRIATHSQNQQNSLRDKRSDTDYRGVYLSYGRYKAQVTYNGITRYLGTYDTPEQAALAYDAFWRSIGSEFATLNFPDA